MKQAHGWDIQAITNTAIVIGSIIFTALVLVTLFNQMQTLITIEDEIAYKKKQANKLYKAIYEDICITFDEIDSRIWLQKAAIWSARVILGVSLVYSL